MRYLLYIACFLCANYSWAQHDGMSNRMLNHTIFNNPGITGNKNTLVSNISFRNDWFTSDNYPRTLTISAHTPLKKENWSLGIMIQNDRIGSFSNNSINGFGSYKLFTTQGTVSFGVKTGLNQLSVTDSDYKLNEADDKNFENNANLWTQNMGIGIYFESNNYYLGVAIPEMTNKTSHSFFSVANKEYWNKRINAGFDFEINSKLNLCTHLIIKKMGQLQPQLEVMPILKINKTYEIGLVSRSSNTFGAVLGYNFTKFIKAYYVFEYTKLNINPMGIGNHELSFSYFIGKEIITENPKIF